MPKYIILIIVVALASVAQTFASSPGGTDSCGLGWMLIHRKSMFGTTTRSTTNVTVPPTFGMTSGTSGCDAHPLIKRDLPTVEYMASNFEPLVIEMANGRGEYLAGLAHMMGCADVAAFGAMTQAEFAALLPTGSDAVSLYLGVKRLGCIR